MGRTKKPVVDEREPRDPRILLWDIETAPILGYTWGAYEQNLLWKEHDSYLLSVAWKWLGDPKVQCVTLNEFELYDEDPRDDYPLVSLAWELFDEADVVVAHNGVAFDTKRTNARIIIQGLDRPSPFKEVDTLTLAKRVFSFTRNNLDEIVQDLGIGEKIQTGGIDLWKNIVRFDDAKSWALMKRYNRHDVEILEALYLRLRQWDDKHPNLATITNRPDLCVTCLHDPPNLVVRGYRHTAVSYRIQYRCSDCGKYMQGREIFKTNTKHVN